MVWVPDYKLYQSNGLTLIYTFDAIMQDNSPQDPYKGYEVTGSRGQGSIHIPGAKASWDLQLKFHLSASDYQTLIAKMDTLQSTIQMNTKYVLKIDRTPSTVKSYNVMRKQPISWGPGIRVKWQTGNIIFRVNSW